MTYEQLDLVILGSIMSTVSREEFWPTYTIHKFAKRKKLVMTCMHHGHHLCKATHNFLHSVGNHQVKAVKQSYQQNGLSWENRLTMLCHIYRSITFSEL